MTEEEYGELLRAVRSRTLSVGRPDLDERLWLRVGRAESSKEQVLAYLSGLRSELALGSRVAVRETMRRLTDLLQDAGGTVEGIGVRIEEGDRAALGVEEIDLVGSPDLDAVVEELDALIQELRGDEE